MMTTQGCPGDARLKNYGVSSFVGRRRDCDAVVGFEKGSWGDV